MEWGTEGVTYWMLSTITLYFAIGHASLRSHAQAVCDALAEGDIGRSRRALSCLVSRNTENLDPQEISAATIESVLENGNDAVFGALFWFVLAGIPGALVYRLINTLDAMWGYKNTRYLYFGRVVAKLDDWINWLPARLTAAAYAILGNTRAAIDCWRTQAAIWKSPNAGSVMATGAGALQLRLGGNARYHNEIQRRPLLGCGSVPDGFDIRRALTLAIDRREIHRLNGVPENTPIVDAPYSRRRLARGQFPDPIPYDHGVRRERQCNHAGCGCMQRQDLTDLHRYTIRSMTLLDCDGRDKGTGQDGQMRSFAAALSQSPQ